MRDCLLMIGNGALFEDPSPLGYRQLHMQTDVRLYGFGDASRLIKVTAGSKILFACGNVLLRHATKRAVNAVLAQVTERGIGESHALQLAQVFHGMYALIYFDVESGTVQLVNDPLGLYPIYRYRVEGCICFSSRQLPLAQIAGLPLRISENAAKTYWYNGHLLSGQSWFEGMVRVRPAQILSWRQTGEETAGGPYWSWSMIPQRRRAGKKEVQACVEAMEHSVDDLQIPEDGLVAVGLSGGLDSRWIAYLLSRRHKVEARCFAQRDAWELSLSKRVARNIGIPHRHFPIDEERWLERRLQLFWDAEGMLHLGHLHEGNQREALLSGISAYFHGFYGGGIYAGCRGLNQRLDGAKGKRYFHLFGEYDGFDLDYLDFPCIDPAIVMHRMRNQAAYSVYGLSACAPVAIPFADPGWLASTYAVDDRDQRDGKFYLRVLRASVPPELMRIPWQRTGLPPAWVGANIIAQRLRLPQCMERVLGLVGRSRHFVSYGPVEAQLEHWLMKWREDAPEFLRIDSLRSREFRMRALSLLVWMRMLEKNRADVED